MTKILKILDFCNLLSYDGKLSITNLALIAMIVKLIVAKTTDLSTLGATIACFANYMQKRAINQPDEKSGSPS